MLLESEEAEECFSKDDLTCVGKTIDSHMTAEASFNDITAFIQSRLPRKKAKFQGSKTAFPPQGADISEEVFLQLAPPGARVRCDRFNGRWQAFLRVPPGPWRSFSRSWGCRTHRECFDSLLAELWKMATAHNIPCHVQGMPPPG